MILPSATELMDQLTTVPLGVLYVTAAAISAFENVFPPFPSDVIVAFSVFLTARAGGPFWMAALATLIGSISGAMLMYYVGRRYGSLVLLEKLERFAGKHAAKQLMEMHAKYGIMALFISRFIPGVRAVVPPFAGAMRLPAWHVFVSMGLAGALWYGFIAYLAFQAGERWETLLATLTRSSKLIGVIAAVLILIAGLVWYLIRRHNARKALHAPPQPDASPDEHA